MSVHDTQSVRATEAHEEYLTEVQDLVRQQTHQLFATLAAAIERESGGSATVEVSNDDHTFTATNGVRSVTCHVDAVTDLPDEAAEKAQAFPTGQAYCTVRTPDGVVAQWVLHRVGSGESIQYIWADVQRQTALTETEVSAALESLFA